MANVRLRSLEMSDLDNIMRWVNDPEVVGNFANFKIPISREEEKKFLEKTLASETDRVFAIENEQGDYVGNVGIHQIHWPSRVGRLGLIIGAKENWNKGYAETAVNEVLGLAFNHYNLHKVWGMVWEDNPKTRHLYIDKCSFKVEGILQDEYFHQGKYHNIIRIAMLEDDYRALVKSREETK
ncbi:MAG TPA: GNAT family protein [Candidatus Nanoarchaeia archaeon]|nr:GNAT family protein [Candidatus Nanoarchaeia archaeon]